jgi:hypothetical protein
LPPNGLEAWELVKARRYEGRIAKDEQSRYTSGESHSWVKMKLRHEGEFVVGGIGQTRGGAPRRRWSANQAWTARSFAAPSTSVSGRDSSRP